MGRSSDPQAFPHTVDNTEPPKPGDLVFGPEGMFVVCVVREQNCTGLLVNPEYTGIVDIPLAEYPVAFTVRALISETIGELEVGSRLQ